MPDIDATPGGDSSNAYIELDDALDRADERIDATAWLTLTEDDQARTLISAARAIDSLDLIGDPTSDEQSMHFPVDGSDSIPPKIEQANLALAISYAGYVSGAAAGSAVVVNPLSPVPSNIKRERVDVIETEYFESTTVNAAGGLADLAAFPLEVQRLLAGYVRDTAALASQWGTGTVVRAS